MNSQSPDFDLIKQVNPYGVEYWSARDLAPLLGYQKWERFEDTVKKGVTVCKLTKLDLSEHFSVTSKTAFLGSGAKREVIDYHLTLYALHLVLICCDMKKPETLRALAYFTLSSLERNRDYLAVAKRLSISIPNNIEITKEQITIGQIRRAFIHLRMEQQFKVGRYYIDLYFPDNKIAVECDEEGHRNQHKYPQEAERKRQSYIEERLKCTFVRYNPDAPNFNICDVIYQIIILVYEKTQRI
jgi:very-short-patch-repair endonuclease